MAYEAGIMTFKIITWIYTMRRNKNQVRKVLFSEICHIENQTIIEILRKYVTCFSAVYGKLL
jgi:hypothetical protein